MPRPHPLHLVLFALLIAPLYAQQPAPESPAVAAIRARDTATLKSLLSHGLDPSQRDSRGESLLGIATLNGDLDAIQLLLAAGAGINTSDHFGPPLTYAISFGHLDAASFLLDHGAAVDGRNSMDQTPLIWAVRADRTDAVALLLAHGADPDLVDRTKVPLLTVASLANSYEIVRLLQKAGAHYNSAEEEMMAAASYGDVIRIRELLAAGTPADFPASGFANPTEHETPLMAAAEKGQTLAVRTLLAAGASVSAMDAERRTALFYAIKSGHRSTVDALLQAGSDPTHIMGGGSTTLMQLAGNMDDPDLARKFIAAGVDPNASTSNGSVFTALMQAATMDKPEVLMVLIAAGADVNARTRLEGETALIDAARSGRLECVRILLRAGADPTIRDHRPNSAKNAREWAIQFSHPEVAALLPDTPNTPNIPKDLPGGPHRF
jgi:ankyrin repeat protein